MKTDNVTLKELIEIATPIDKTAYTRENFLSRITPELEKDFSEKYTEQFKRLIEEKKAVYFIINFTKAKIMTSNPTIKLSTCGKEELPTISLNR